MPQSGGEGKPRVLFVDDDAMNLLTLGALLEESGYDTSTADSIARGREMVARGPYDLAILDVHLRDGFGPALIPPLRGAFPEITIAILSGSLGSEEVKGADLVLGKAGDPQELLDRLRLALERRRAGRGPS